MRELSLAQLEDNRATTAIWELEVFWMAGLQILVEGDRRQGTRALVAGLVGRRHCKEQLKIFGGRSSWKSTRLPV